jgi:Mg2+-importing ATPase
VTFLPFLPMLPTQILLNNILYDLSEVTIPFDAVDPKELQYPQEMDMPLIRHFMFTLGPVSSLFDFLTFYMMLALFQADEHLFQTGWFVESLCTQVLVIFVIRTRDKCWLSKPHPWLIATSLGVVGIALVLPLSPIAPYFGFTPPPLTFYGALMSMTLIYLCIVEIVKAIFLNNLGRKQQP